MFAQNNHRFFNIGGTVTIFMTLFVCIHADSYQSSGSLTYVRTSTFWILASFLEGEVATPRTVTSGTNVTTRGSILWYQQARVSLFLASLCILIVHGRFESK